VVKEKPTDPKNPREPKEKIVQHDREDEQFVCGYEKTQF